LRHSSNYHNNQYQHRDTRQQHRNVKIDDNQFQDNQSPYKSYNFQKTKQFYNKHFHQQSNNISNKHEYHRPTVHFQSRNDFNENNYANNHENLQRNQNDQRQYFRRAHQDGHKR
jgi:hypothetical protein